MSKLKNGAKSLFTIAKNAVTGVEQDVPEEVAEKRLNICLACDKLKMPLKQCGECFCFINFKTKVRQEQCPIGKWKAYEPNV